jgi:hypothetical protein
MRIVNLATFLTMPEGTFYQKYQPCYFGHLAIFEGRCGEIDFISDDAIELPIPTELVDAMVEMNETCEVDFENTGRDGMFEPNQLFAVWERGDIKRLMTACERAMNNFEANGDA